jgi:FkbM family methyltransferase
MFRGDQESELRYIHRIIKAREVAIDIGANVGLYSYRMATLFNKVYSFEINDELTGDLKAYNPGNIEILHVGLSDETKESTLHIPVHNGVRLTGWGSLSPTNCPDATALIERRVQLRTLDSYQLQPVSFVKIDVEGHELAVLQGGRQTILRNRPLMLIEIRPQNRAAIQEYFNTLEYRESRLEHFMNCAGSAENYFYLPREAK